MRLRDPRPGLNDTRSSARSPLGAALVLAIVSVGVGIPVDTAAATPHLYWTNYGDGSIGRADLDGTNVDQGFITGASDPIGIDAGGSHLYWTNEGSDSVGRADLDGTDVDQGLIGGADAPSGVAVGAGHIYWVNNGTGSIGRADLDGTNVDQAFITGGTAMTGVAVDAHHVYWVNQSPGSIGRADLDGTDVDHAFIPGVANPGWALAVDDDHIHWTNWKDDTIGRADVDGTDVEPGFITGADNPLGVAVDAADPLRRPDGLISKVSKRQGFVGDGIYSAKALASQTRSIVAGRTKRTYSFWVRIQNDGETGDRFHVKGTATRSGGVTVAYVVGGIDRTADIVAGTYRTKRKAPGGSVTVVIKIAVPAGTRAAKGKVLLTATSVAQASAIDTVRAVVKR